MVRFLFLLLGFALGFSQNPKPTDRTLIADGDYVGQDEKGSKPIANWKLWHLSSGDYEVIESFVRNSAVTQTFRFDSKFMPIGYSLGISPTSGAATHSGYTSSHPMNIACAYKTTELTCDVEYEGRKSRTSIPASEPYVVFLDEGWWADVTWTLTGVIRVMEHTGTREAVVNSYVIKDNDTGGITLKPDRPMKLTLTGEEKANVLGKIQTVRRYEDRDSGEHTVLLVTTDGLVAVASLGATALDSARLAMGNYQEYKPLGISGR